MPLDHQAADALVDEVWTTSIVGALQEYIRIPNVSPAYDRNWHDDGHMDAAVELARQWCEARPIDGLQAEVVRLPGRTPVLLLEVPATGPSAGSADDTVLLYGHLDKQPPMHGWRDGLGPWEPVLDDGRLYGRGGADDAYATFASLTAIEAVRASAGDHARCVALIECSEESGSPDLPAYVDHLAERIGRPSLVVCLDSGCATYDRLWATTSLRGNLIGALRVDVLTEGVHSGGAGGIVPSSFRILRRLLDRVEDPDTGSILLTALEADVPDERRHQLAATAADIGARATRFPWADGVGLSDADPAAMLLANTWEACLSVTGMDGIPLGEEAGNVLRPRTEATLSFRLPPTVEAERAAAALVDAFVEDPPPGSVVSFDVHSAESGWDAPPTESWLAEAVDHASLAVFGRPSGASAREGRSRSWACSAPASPPPSSW